MSAENKAVFLSYASQDAEAARRICEALRSGGVEVWFDADGGLEHGDEWDAKIRRQIKECVLFIPIISASTQARHEGYFRIEWELAAQRAMGIASGVPFILPVVIDDTREPNALVPDRFRAVQWTRLRNGEVPADVLQRFLKLWSHRTGVLKHEADAGRGRQTPPDSGAAAFGDAALQQQRRRPWLVTAILGAATVAAFMAVERWAPWRKPEKSPAVESKTAVVAPATSVFEARQLVAKAWEQMNKPEMARAELEIAAAYCKQATGLEPNDAAAWAAWSQVDSWSVYHNFDSSPARREAARTKAARAMQLDPGSFEARLARACQLVRGEGDSGVSMFAPEAERLLRTLLQEKPDEPRALLALGILLRNTGAFPECREVFGRMAKNPASAAQAWDELGWAEYFAGNLRAARLAIDTSIARQPYWGNLTLKEILAQWWLGDLDLAKATLDRMPVASRQEDIGVYESTLLAYWRREPEAMLQILNDVPRDWLQSNGFEGPKAWFAALAHQMAGHDAAAQVQWRTALDVVERRLADQPDSGFLIQWKGTLLAASGNRAAAEPVLRLAHEIGSSKFNFATDAADQVLLGHLDAAMTLLEQMVEAGKRSVTAAAYRLDPRWDPLRDQPRFKALLARMEADPRFSPNAPEKPAAAAAATSDSKSVAVLAFTNLSDDKGNEYFSDGLSENILDKLARNPGLRVMARTSSFSYKGRNVPIAQIAQELHVGTIIEGSVQRAGPRLRVTAQLVNAADGTQVWSETYDRELTDIFAVQDEIALKIAARLAPGTASAQPEQRPTANLDAYDAYLHGLEVERQGVGNNLIARAVPYYEEAVRLDPSFALAWARLAHALAWFYWGGGLPGGDELTRARQALAEAVRLQPALPQVHWAHAAILRADGVRLDEAAHELALAESNQPANADTLLERAMVARFAGRLDEALDLCHRAAERDPRNPVIFNTSGLILIYLGRYPEALAAFDQCTKLGFGSSPRENKAIVVLRTTGDAVAALREFASIAPNEVDDEVRVNQVDFLEAAGDYAGALANIDRVERPAFLLQWGYTVRALLKARVREAMGDAAGAQRDCRDALPLALDYQGKNPQSWRAYPALALAYAGLGKKEEALAAAQAALALVPPAESPYYAQRATLPVQVEVLARFGLIDEALAIVREEITAGWWRRNDLLHLPGFFIIRKDPRFRAIAEKAPL